jgi:hypothetical protein
MAIPFIEYRLPNGSQHPCSIERPFDVEALAANFMRAGGRFECEILRTGQVSLTAVAEVDGEAQDIDIEIVRNGPDVGPAVDKLVRRVSAYVVPA